MAKGKLSEDTIKFILEADSSQAQQEIHKTGKTIEQLEGQRKKLLEQQAAMRRAHLTESKEYKDLTRDIKKNEQAIANENLKLQELYKKLGTSSMTMAQLRKEAKNLQKQLDNTSQALQPQAYKQYADKLAEVKNRMTELRGTAEQVKGSFGNGGILKSFFGAKMDMGALKTMISSSGIVSALTFVADQAVQAVQSIMEKIKWFYDFNIQVEEARRLTREFIGTADENLTHVQSQISAIAKELGKEYKDVLGSVDVLMNQFGLTEQEAIDNIKDGIQAGADVNGTFLSQIQQYAPAFRDAGISVQNLVALITQTRSGIFNEQGMSLIQTATNRIRTMTTATQKALDGIGISSQQLEADLVSGKTSIVQAIQMISSRIMELPENSQQVGEVMKDVFGKTASNEGMKMIDTIAHISTNMDDLKGVTGEYGELQRKQIETQAELNEKLSDMFGIGKGGFEELTTKASIFIMRGLIKIINYCKQLYDELYSMRLAVAVVKTAFDLAFKAIELGFDIIIDVVKGLAKELKGLSNIVEGVFTFDFKKVKDGWKQTSNAITGMAKELWKDSKNIGKRFGSNFMDSLNNVIGSKNIKVPTVNGGTLGEVTVRTKLPKPVNKGGGTGKKGKTTHHTSKADPDAATTKAFSSDRSQDLEEAKRSYNEDLNALKQALAEKRLTQEQYNAYLTALNIQHQNNLLAIEASYQARSQNIAIKDSEKRKQLQQQQDKAVADQKQAAMNAYIEAEKQYYDTLEKLQGTAPTAPQTLQQECDAKLLVLDGYYQASLQLAKDEAERQKQTTEAYESAKAAIKADYARKAAEETAKARQEYGLDTFEDQYAAQAAKRKADYDKGIISKKEYDQAMANLDQQAEEHRMQIRQQYGLASQQELYDAELEQLKMHLQNKEISETEYEEAVKNLKIEKMKEAFDYYSNLSSGAVQALQQAEEANIDAKYDAEIEAARNAGKDTTEIEKKKANEKLNVQKKYADVNFAIKASQIIADTATSIMRAYSDLGPIAGTVAAVLMGVTGTAQLAAANAERQKVKRMTLSGSGSTSEASGTRVATGLESGGAIDVEREQDGRRFHAAYDPKKRGFVDRPTVIVGEGGYGHSREWVASNAAVENPTVAPILDIIDRAQRAGSIRTLDMGKFLLQQAQGRATGGSIASLSGDNTTAIPSGMGSGEASILQQLTAVLDRISTEGIPASVALNELEQKQQLLNRSRKFGSK